MQRRVLLTMAGSVLFVWYVVSLDIDSIGRTVSSIDVRSAAVLLSLSFASGLMKYLRWETLLRLQNQWHDCNRLDEYLAVNAAFFVGLVTPGTAGELSRGPLSRVDSSRATALVALEKTTDLAVLVALSSAALAISVDGLVPGAFVLLASALTGTFIFWMIRRHSAGVRRSIAGLAKLVGKEEHSESVVNLLRPFKEAVHDPRLVVWSAVYSAVLWIMPSLQMYVILRVLEGPVSLAAAALSFLVPYLLGILSMIPAGIGVFDITSSGLARWVSAAGGPASGMVAPLYFRVFVTVPLVMLGYTCLLVSQSRGPRRS